MQLNNTVQHRVKHFDQLLGKEMAYLSREYQQNLSTIDKFERSIRHQTDKKKVSLSIDEIYDKQTETIDYNKLKRTPNGEHDFPCAGTDDESSQIQTESEVSSLATSNESVAVRRRHCMKADKLPPIYRPQRNNRSKLFKSQQWTSSFGCLDRQKQHSNKSLGKDHRFIKTKDFSSIDSHVQLFLNDLPPSKDIQFGFDAFGPSSLYSNRLPVIMRWVNWTLFVITNHSNDKKTIRDQRSLDLFFYFLFHSFRSTRITEQQMKTDKTRSIVHEVRTRRSSINVDFSRWSRQRRSTNRTGTMSFLRRRRRSSSARASHRRQSTRRTSLRPDRRSRFLDERTNHFPSLTDRPNDEPMLRTMYENKVVSLFVGPSMTHE